MRSKECKRRRDEDSDDAERKKRQPAPRRRARDVPRYKVQMPKFALDMPEADVFELNCRYTNMYIPSDFFCTSIRWVDAFPPHSHFALDRPCAYHVMNKEVDPLVENDAVLEPADADYSFSAKVMLLSMPSMDEVYRKCCSLAEDKDKDGDDRDLVHPAQLTSFLVGLRGKNETMAVGGPWSPSLDGPDPDKDPSVLIKTAVRTCKALTGIDLSECTQWYRFVEVYYWRRESTHKGKPVPARVETVVIFLPDVWSCLPTRLEMDNLRTAYRTQLERKLGGEGDSQSSDDTKDSDDSVMGVKKEPTHFPELDPKTMKVSELRSELEARTMSPKGLKSQLIARLTKAIKTESDKDEEEGKKADEAPEVKQEEEDKEMDEETKEEEDKRKKDEREWLAFEKGYVIPDNPHIVVHPSKTAKGGKFDCTVMSLSLLLRYRRGDNKEHSFEVSLFAELFNEMLMRDHGCRIYRALQSAPYEVKEEEKDEYDEDEDEEDDEEDDSSQSSKDDKDKMKSDKDRKRRDRPKLYTEDPNLLVSFTYFDTSHCGYIFEEDLEQLLYTLGLNLSRAQVRRLVLKVVVREALHYRKLTDKLKVEEVKDGEEKPAETAEPVTEESKDTSVTLLSYGNKHLLPVFKDGSPAKRARTDDNEKSEKLPEGYVMYKGGLLDVGKLTAQLKRSEQALKDTEARMMSTREQYESEVSDLTTQLDTARTELNELVHLLRYVEEHPQEGRTGYRFTIKEEPIQNGQEPVEHQTKQDTRRSEPSPPEVKEELVTPEESETRPETKPAMAAVETVSTVSPVKTASVIDIVTLD